MSAYQSLQPSTVLVEIKINGLTVAAEIEPRLLLVHFIREQARLTGTHIGCDTSQCGACTIEMNGNAVKSCTIFAVQADGVDITTIEGVAEGDQLDSLQQSFTDMHALQCGFCTPGMIMSARQILRRFPDPTEEIVRAQLDGNICRCTGYHNIVKAILHAARGGSMTAKVSQPSAA